MRALLIDYPSHRPWIWFTWACLALATGAYNGLSWLPSAPLPAPVAATVLLALPPFLALAARCLTPSDPTPWPRWFVRVALLLAVTAFLLASGALVGRLGATADGPTGSSLFGLWFGILGAACMVFAGLLPLLRRAPATGRLGRRQWWLKGHIWLGLLSGVLILYHSGCRLGGLLEQALWLILALVIVSGLVGVVLQQVVPRLLTVRVPGEVPYEQVPHHCLALRRRADEMVDGLCGIPGTADAPPKGSPLTDAAARAALREAYERVVRPFLGPQFLPSSPLAQRGQATVFFGTLRALQGLSAADTQLKELESYCEDRRQLGEQERLHHWLHVWLLAHVPLSALLLGLGIAHVVVSLYY